MDYYNKIVINNVEFSLETVIVGSGEPTSSTSANVGQLYMDSSDSFEVYICVSKTSSGVTSWQKLISSIEDSEIIEIVNDIT